MWPTLIIFFFCFQATLTTRCDILRRKTFNVTVHNQLEDEMTLKVNVTLGHWCIPESECSHNCVNFSTKEIFIIMIPANQTRWFVLQESLYNLAAAIYMHTCQIVCSLQFYHSVLSKVDHRKLRLVQLNFDSLRFCPFYNKIRYDSNIQLVIDCKLGMLDPVLRLIKIENR